MAPLARDTAAPAAWNVDADPPSVRLAAAMRAHCLQAGDAHGAVASRDHGVSARLPIGIGAIDAALGGGLAVNALHEVRCHHARDIGAATGVALGLLAQLTGFSPHAQRVTRTSAQRIVWVSEPGAQAECGTLFPAGLAQYGLDPACFTLVTAQNLMAALWAADEAAGCGDVAAMILHLRGNPARFGLTQTRRLMVRARENGVLALILRQSGEEEATAAATRWLVEAAPSGTMDDDQRGIGCVRHILTLERNRNGQTGQWPVAWNMERKAFDHAAQTGPAAHPVRRLHRSGDRPDRAHEMGQVLALGRAS